MAKSIMVLGTGSSVGKSIITSGLCRVFFQDGYNVAPFKSQNMALNSFITEDGDEMGRAQVVQAEAAGKKPSVLMNPILLKPSTDRKSQVILNGKVFKNMSAVEYHNYKPKLKEMIAETYDKLSKNHDIIVIEGAGSPAEINLRENDLVNMGMAEISDSPVVLVGDIDRGGVFASLYGTIMLLTEEERNRVKGVIINKFRGDVDILMPGIKMLEELIKIPVLGVVPYTHLKIEDEDSLSERFYKNRNSEGQINIEVLYLPHVSNFTDFDVFETQDDVNLRYVMRGESIGDPDILIIPGSKNTIEDLIYLRNSGLEEQIVRLSRKNKFIVGICGGYQILGNKIHDPYHTESVVAETHGIGLLETNTIFELKKTTTQVKGKISDNLPERLKSLVGKEISGYEIHMGITNLSNDCGTLLKLTERLGNPISEPDGAFNGSGNVFGTYVHGIFDNIEFTREFLNIVRKEKGLDLIDSKIQSFSQFKENEYNKLADVIRESLDIEKIYKIVNEGNLDV
jgi:adenosylcobyric acid synthase